MVAESTRRSWSLLPRVDLGVVFQQQASGASRTYSTGSPDDSSAGTSCSSGPTSHRRGRETPGEQGIIDEKNNASSSASSSTPSTAVLKAYPRFATPGVTTFCLKSPTAVVDLRGDD